MKEFKSADNDDSFVEPTTKAQQKHDNAVTFSTIPLHKRAWSRSHYIATAIFSSLMNLWQYHLCIHIFSVHCMWTTMQPDACLRTNSFISVELMSILMSITMLTWRDKQWYCSKLASSGICTWRKSTPRIIFNFTTWFWLGYN